MRTFGDHEGAVPDERPDLLQRLRATFAQPRSHPMCRTPIPERNRDLGRETVSSTATTYVFAGPVPARLVIESPTLTAS
jgi:hypothetical protein